MPDITSTVARNLRFYRTKQGLSQKELGEKAGLGGQTVSNIESGRGALRLTTIQSLAKALGIEETDLFQTELAEKVMDHPLDECVRRVSSAALSSSAATAQPQSQLPATDQRLAEAMARLLQSAGAVRILSDALGKAQGRPKKQKA